MIINDVPFEPYHSKTKSRSIEPELRKFIAWDGEGANLDGPNKPQSYILFGCSEKEPIVNPAGHLHTFDILDYIISVGLDNPSAFHVGFAFGYDANMICRSLNTTSLVKLHKKGKLSLRSKSGLVYHINYLPKKWFSVTRFGANWNRKSNSTDKITVRIYDIFGFFGKRFVDAYEEYVGPADPHVKLGKEERKDFAELGIEYVKHYWSIEIGMLKELAEELRVRLYGAGLRITQWHGPGALASYSLRLHNIDKAKSVTPREVREAAKYAYAGGRFEIFRLGRIVDGPIYSLDINSAYPYGISKLPSLATGTWTHVGADPKRIARFGVYHVRMHPKSSGDIHQWAPGPLYHRDKMGNISYPWRLEGWYWSPEVRNLRKIDPARYEILEGWEYITDQNLDSPFEWVSETYDLRREWKAIGLASQVALKLMLNSLYGKMAQRVGWNQETRTPPKWHQLEWAGWTTSLTRAMLWDVMARIPFDKLIAVETDGLYTTMNPAELGIKHSTELGKWEIGKYDEIMYVQSGMAWLRSGDEWTCKRRGLDKKTFGLQECKNYLKALVPGDSWKAYEGETTRFIGLGAALMSNTPLKDKHCRWETTERKIRPGQDGKRIHIHSQCQACQNGRNAYEQPHDMSIRSLAYAPGCSLSKPHDIPWDGDAPQPWRTHDDYEKHTEGVHDGCSYTEI